MGSWNINLDGKDFCGQILSPEDLQKASNLPGIYAWHSVMNLGNADVSERKYLTNALKRQNSRFKKPPLDGIFTANLGSQWTGKLLDKSMDNLTDALDDEELSDGKKIAVRLNRTIDNSKARKLLPILLDACSPVFSSPLYIGISDNLRRRLMSHIQNFRQLSEYKNKKIKIKNSLLNLDVEEDDSTSGINFAARAVIAGFKEDSLRVVTFPIIDTDSLAEQEIFDLIASVEFLLNRWNRPILGGK